MAGRKIVPFHWIDRKGGYELSTKDLLEIVWCDYPTL